MSEEGLRKRFAELEERLARVERIADLVDQFADETLHPLLDRIERLEAVLELLMMSRSSDPTGVANELDAAVIERDLGLPPVARRKD